MKHYSFREGEPDPTYTFDFEQSLFNLRAHRQLQREEGWLSFYIINEKHRGVAAAIHFNLFDNTAASPLRAPFGSVECSESIPLSTLFNFLQFVEGALRKRGINKIMIKNSPQLLYERLNTFIQTFLFNLGYTVVDAEVGSVIRISEQSFDTTIDDWEHRKLRQAREGDLVCRPIEPKHFADVYDFILQCRTQKGYPLSMSFEQLKAAFNTFPQHYKLFGVFQNHTLTAASIAIRVNSDTLYNFYAAHSEAFDKLSPVVMLIEGLYNFCRQSGMRFLDLGTSAVNGQPNFGLLDFKLNLGGIPTPKLTFEKILS